MSIRLGLSLGLSLATLMLAVARLESCDTKVQALQTLFITIHSQVPNILKMVGFIQEIWLN